MQKLLKAELLERSNLTTAQLLIWTGQQLDPAAPLYNMAVACELAADIDTSVFQQAFDLLVAQSEALRTTVTSDDGIPRQLVQSTVPGKLLQLDFADAPDPQQKVRRWSQQRCTRLFEMDQCLFDTALIRLAPDRFVWYLNQHHLITDAWSVTLIVNRVTSYYDALLTDRWEQPPLLPSYQAFVQYEQSQRRAAQADGHAQHLPNRDIRPPQLYSATVPDASTQNERVTIDWGTPRSARLRQLARHPDVRALTPDLSCFNIFATLLFAYLHRVSGQRELAIGIPAHNRHNQEFKETIGLFTQVYPLCVTVDPADTLLQLVHQVRLATTELLRATRLGDDRPQHHRLFNTVLNYIHASFAPFGTAPIRSEWLHPGHCDRGHWLRLQVQDFDATGRFVLHFDVNRDLIEAARHRSVIDHFLRLADGFLEDWQQQIANIDILTPAERRQQLVDFNATDTAAAQHSSVVEEFVSHAQRHATSIALICGPRHMTYRSLDQRAASLQAELQRCEIGPGSVVGICMPRSFEFVVAVLGVLRTGASYVPIDPRFPSGRVAFMIADAAISVVLARRELDGSWPSDIRTIIVDAESDIEEALPDPPALAEMKPDDPAYILYTSGSTGQPKGVIVTHRGLSNYAHWARQYYAGDRRLAFPLFSPLTFDLTITSVFVPLISGGTIAVYPETDGTSDLSLLEVLRDNQVDIIKLTPSHLLLLHDRDLSGSRVRQLILGGEDLRQDVALSIWKAFGGRVEIHNEYGPTEATVGCVVHTFDPAVDRGTSVPIGRPIENMQAYVLDEHLQPVPQGVLGELYVSGAGLARGYCNQDDLTSERFVPHRFRPGTKMYRTGDTVRWGPCGNLEYLGRRDDQVKIRGARVELGEIESVLSQHPQVTACCLHVIRPERPAREEEVVYCSRCGLASNYPGAAFDGQRVCNFCNGFSNYQQKARQYFSTMDDLRARFAALVPEQKRAYDCLALLSGGKDSTYMLCRLVDLGLRVLAFTLDNGYISDQAKANIKRVVETLGVDHVFGTTPAMDQIFADSLRRHSNVCQGCFKTIYTLSLRLAREKSIPYIVTGLSRGQFFETRLTEELFTDSDFDVARIDQIILDARKAYHRVDDAVLRLLETDDLRDGSIFREVEFIDFYRYCPVELDEMLAYLKQRVPSIRPTDTGRSTNCLINDVGIYVHQRERGYHNYAFPYSWDVRMGHKTRSAALAELNDEIDVEYVHQVLDDIGYPPPPANYASEQRLVAYYTAAGAPSEMELKQHLASQLPDFMVPTSFVQLTDLPLTPHGKVDREALPAPKLDRSLSQVPYMAPQTPTEKSLARIWSEVLRVPRVGLRDNFFDLGGDSISAIQIVARANRAGLQLVPGQLFDGLNVENLAELCGANTAGAAEPPPPTGPVPLSPIQNWFFEHFAGAAAHFSQVVSVRLSHPDVAALQMSLRELTARHDALRTRFRRHAGAWQAELVEAVKPPSMRVVDAAGLDDAQLRRRVEEVAEELSRSNDLEEPCLLQIALFNQSPDASLMLLVIHHLVVDAVSWTILLADLDSLYAAHVRGVAAELPRTSAPFQRWSANLTSYAGTDEAREQLVCWRERLQVPVAPLPLDSWEHGGPAVNLSGSVTARLELESSRALLQDVPRAGVVQVPELLIAALALTLSEWTQETNVCISLEGHGRERIGAELDVSRTVGWFTTIFPLTIQLPAKAELATSVRLIKEQIRSVPHRGVGYGVLRFLSPDAAIRQELAESDCSQVLFNYLGRADSLVSPDLSLKYDGPLMMSRDASAARPFLLEITALFDDEQLCVDWIFSRQHHQKYTINRLQDSFLDHVRMLVKHCRDAANREASASDFPLANLDHKKLEKVASLLQKTDKTR